MPSPGSNFTCNLCPQSYRTQPWTAHAKDRLENRLHTLVSSRKISLTEAQRTIANNWTAAYL